MKSFRQYLCDKYLVDTPTTFLRAESIVMGIPYPPMKGWLKAYGDLPVTPEMERRMGELSDVDDRKERNALARKLRRSGVGVIRPKRECFEATPGFLRTYAWRSIRMAALKKCGARCQCCGATTADGVTLNVDHIKPRELYPQLALDINNLQVLCEVCNHGKGNWDMTDWRSPHKRA